MPLGRQGWTHPEKPKQNLGSVRELWDLALRYLEDLGQ
jgi:hypothetical protein